MAFELQALEISCELSLGEKKRRGRWQQVKKNVNFPFQKLVVSALLNVTLFCRKLNGHILIVLYRNIYISFIFFGIAYCWKLVHKHSRNRKHFKQESFDVPCLKSSFCSNCTVCYNTSVLSKLQLESSGILGRQTPGLHTRLLAATVPLQD